MRSTLFGCLPSRLFAAALVGVCITAYAQYPFDPNEFDLSGFPPSPTNFEEQQVMEEIRAVRSPRRNPSAAEKGSAHERLGTYYEKRGDHQRASVEFAKARYWYQNGQGPAPAAPQTPGYSAAPPPSYPAGSAYPGGYPAAPPGPPSGAYPQSPGYPPSGYPTPGHPGAAPPANYGGYPSESAPANPAYGYPPAQAPGAAAPAYPSASAYPSNGADGYSTNTPTHSIAPEPRRKRSSELLRDIVELLGKPAD